MTPARPVLGIDLDGTVLDCRPRQQTVLAELYHEARPHLDAIWQMKRDGVSTAKALMALDLDPGIGFAQRWLDRIEQEDVLARDTVMAEAEVALARMRRRVDLHLITSRQSRDGVMQTLVRLGLSGLFAHVEVVSTGPGAAKAKAQHLRASRAVAHCGDSEVDGAAAQAAKLPFWAVTCGQRSGGFLLENASPAFIADDLAGIARAFDALLDAALAPR
ncbi:MAG: hypothetical protein AAF280_10075 [Pseudomonadota bacterium]